MKVTDGNHNSTVTGYDLSGRVTSRTVGVTAANPSGSGTTTYVYDDQGRLASAAAPGKNPETIVYVNGNPVTSTAASKTVTEPSGATVTTILDADSRPVTVNYSDGTPTVNITYDQDSRVKTEVAPTSGLGGIINVYDSLGQLESRQDMSRIVYYTYVAPGRVFQVTYPFGDKITRGYDSVDRWTTVTDSNNQTTTFGYDTDGNVATVQAPSGVTTTRTFDADGHISDVNVKNASSTTLADWAYSRDQAGLLTSTAASGVGTSTTWSNDAARQLTGQSAGPAASYGYDPSGDPTTLGSTTQSFDASGELCWTAPTVNVPSGAGCSTTPSGGTGFVYNQNGQRTTEGNRAYTWNAAGELTGSNRGAGVNYLYDPNGLRVQETWNNQYSRFTWDTTTGTPQLIGDQSPTRNLSFLYGPDGLPFEQTTTTTNTSAWLTQDATGSVRLTTDGTGTVTSTSAWTPWGTSAGTTGTQPALGYDSNETDPSGLIYLQHRYYDPTTAQFISPDPLDAVTGQRYGYVDNSPLDNQDPTGMICGAGASWDPGSGYNPACDTSEGYRANCDVTECPPPYLATSRFGSQTWQYATESDTPAGYVPCNAEQAGNFPPYDAMGEWRATHPLAARQYDDEAGMLSNWTNPTPSTVDGASGLSPGEACIVGMPGCESRVHQNWHACMIGGFTGGASGLFAGGPLLAVSTMMVGCLVGVLGDEL